jgi:hypothetical protein
MELIKMENKKKALELFRPDSPPTTVSAGIAPDKTQTILLEINTIIGTVSQHQHRRRDRKCTYLYTGWAATTHLCICV